MRGGRCCQCCNLLQLLLKTTLCSEVEQNCIFGIDLFYITRSQKDLQHIYSAKTSSRQTQTPRYKLVSNELKYCDDSTGWAHPFLCILSIKVHLSKYSNRKQLQCLHLDMHLRSYSFLPIVPNVKSNVWTDKSRCLDRQLEM